MTTVNSPIFRLNVVASSQLGALANGMTAGQWSQLTGATNMNYLADTVTGGVGHILPYSGKAPYDSVRRRVWYSGSDDPGNGMRTVYYDLATHAWVLVAGFVDSTSRPPNHAGSQQAVDLVNRRYWRNRITATQLEYFNLDVSGTQTPTGVSVPGSFGGIPDPGLEYFPDRQSLIACYGLVLWERPNSTGTWGVIGSCETGYSAICVYCPFNHCVLFGGGNNVGQGPQGRKLYRLDANGIKTQFSEASVPIDVDEARNEYVEDPTTGVVHVIHRNASICSRYTLNVQTGVWTDVGLSGVPAILQNGNQQNCVATTIPEHKVHLWLACNQGSQSPQMWLYKYAN